MPELTSKPDSTGGENKRKNINQIEALMKWNFFKPYFSLKFWKNPWVDPWPLGRL
jgi:hypothetical protein